MAFRDGRHRAALQTAVSSAAPRPISLSWGFAFASDAWAGQGSGNTILLMEHSHQEDVPTAGAPQNKRAGRSSPQRETDMTSPELQ